MFIQRHINDLSGQAERALLIRRWRTPQAVVHNLATRFNQIAEELIDPERLINSSNEMHSIVGAIYRDYHQLLHDHHKADFAHLHRWAYDLLQAPADNHSTTSGIQHLLVDEYQDTSPIQDKLLLNITKPNGNITVVGDDDQGIYGFRGASVRNIIEFPHHFRGARILELTTNYRSHPDIVASSNDWMAAAAHRAEPNTVRHHKTIVPAESTRSTEYPPIIAVQGKDRWDEAARLAELISFLKDHGTIRDYEQVALLLHTVRLEKVGPYVHALKQAGIPVFVHGSRDFFYRREVRDIIACFGVIFDRQAGDDDEIDDADYLQDTIEDLKERTQHDDILAQTVRAWRDQIAQLPTETPEHDEVHWVEDLFHAKGAPHYTIIDYFYHLMATPPFTDYIGDNTAMHNLATLSRLLDTFQQLYGYGPINHHNLEQLRQDLFDSFLPLLLSEGVNDQNDAERRFPTGHVQIMTIHQAKGLEFPVVIVDSLDFDASSSTCNDQRRYSPDHDPDREAQYTHLDPERRHYVAFTRPQHLLVLTANGQTLPRFQSIWDHALPWDDSAKQRLSQQRFLLTHSTTTHERYSVTGDVQLYETCPRQYQFFKVYGFAKPYQTAHTFGQLVHRSIDLIHRSALACNAANATTGKIRAILSEQHARLVEAGCPQLNLAQRTIALSQVQRYWQHARHTADAIIGSEVPVSIDGADHTLTGRLDLITQTNRGTELTDFKTGHRNSATPEAIGSYVRRLALYAEMLPQHAGRPIQRLSIHWTAEADFDQAIYTVENTSKLMADARIHADRVIRNIRARAFQVHQPPGQGVCNQCNLLKICQQDGTLRQ